MGDLVWKKEPGFWRALSDESGAEYVVEHYRSTGALLFEDSRHIGSFRTIAMAKAAAADRDNVLGAA